MWWLASFIIIINRNNNILKFFIKTFHYLKEISQSELGFEPNKTEKAFLDKQKRIVMMNNIIAENYNKEFNKMKDELKQTHKNDKIEFTSKMRNFFILRVICVVLAFCGYF